MEKRTGSPRFSSESGLADLCEEINPHVQGFLRVGYRQIHVAARRLRHFSSNELISPSVHRNRELEELCTERES